MELLWTVRARRDLTAIGAYIAERNPRAAELLMQELRNRIERLPEMPRLGRAVPELEDDALRELVEGSYRILYRLLDGTVEVVRIVHARRRLPILDRE